MVEIVTAFLASPAGVAILGALGLALVSAIFVLLRVLVRQFKAYALKTPNKIDDAFAVAAEEAVEHGEDAAKAAIKKRQ